MIREINDNPKIGFYPMGFLDDDQTKIGRTLQGIPILGKIDDISKISLDFEEILIAIPSAKGEQMRRIVEVCEKSGKKYRTLPAIGELIDGSVSLKAIREVTLGDLLGREEVLLIEKKSVTTSKINESWLPGRGDPSVRNWSGKFPDFTLKL